MDPTTHELICKLHSSLSALEKKRMAELFGTGYPKEDLNGDACLRVVAKFRKSARGKLKVQSLLSHFHAHFALSEKDQIRILDETVSENECAMRFLDIVNIKASFPIGALYLALIESSNEQYGPPTHYQLACELKRIVQEESSHISLTMVDSTKSSNGMDENQALLDIIERLRGIMVTLEQAQSLSEKWGIDKILDTTDLSQICYQWKTKRGVWCTKHDLIEGLVLTRGVGRHLVKLKTAMYPQLKPFLQGLQYQWTNIAEYIGFEEFEIKTITEANEEISEQLNRFLDLWNIPDCGDKTVIILQRLKMAAGIQDVVIKPAANKIGMSSQLSLDPSIVPVMSSPKALDPLSASLPASLPSDSLSTGFTRIQPSKGYPSRLRLTIIQPKLLTQSYESSFDQKVHSNDGSALPPPSITEVLPSTPVSDKEDHSEILSNHFNDLSSTVPPSKVKGIYHQENPVDSDSPSLPVVTSINSLPSKPSLLTSQTTVESQVTNKLAIQFPPIDDSQTITPNDTERLSNSQSITAKVQLPQVASESEWPSPIQQSQMTFPSALPLPSYQANLLFTAPISTTNLTWSANPPTSHALVMSRSSLYEVRSVESDSSYPQSLPPPFPSPIISRPQTTDAMVVCPSSSTVMSQKEHLSAAVNSDQMKDSSVMMQSSHNEESALEVPKSVSSMSENEVTECKQNDTKPTDTPVIHHFGLVDLVESLLDTNDVERFETVLKSLQNAVYEINKSVPLEFSQCGEAPLHLAVAKGYVEKVTLLIRYGANVDQVENSKGYSPLHIACKTGNVEVVNLLINNRANVNQNDKSLNTPLIVACLNIKPRCVSILINSGADIEASNKDGLAALDVAVVVGSLEIVHLLLNSDLPANVHRIRTCVADGNEYRVTPIADAGARGHLEIFKMLEEKGADINTTGPKNKIPDIKLGYIPPLLLACMNNQVEIVRYITSRERFDSKLPCIADPVVEALKGRHFECAELIWKRYGGFQLMLEDSTEFQELNEVLKAVKNDYGNAEHEPSAAKDEMKLNQEQEHDPSNTNGYSKRENILLTDADSDIDEMTAQEVNDLSTCEEAPVSDGGYGETQLNISTTSLGSQSHKTTAQSVVFENDLMNNLSDVDTMSSQSQTKAASAAASSQLASYTMNDINPLDSKQEGGSATDATTDDDPFAPRPKSPIPFTHTDLLPPSDTEMSIAQAVDISGNLRSFQTSAIEVLHHFAQYLILACLQRHSEEDIISRAEGIGEPSLVHFFSRYFHDSAGAARGSDFVAEFIRGFPSPLNFLLSAQLCRKEEFEGVLRDFGNTEFPEQLMLALHQFPDSDNIPWSGTELLNALFRQTFSVGTPFPVPAMQMRTQQERSRESQPSTSAVRPSFPGDGHVLGRREGPPLTTPTTSKKVPVFVTTQSPHPQDSLSQATKTGEIDSASGGMNNLDAADDTSFSPQTSTELQESVNVGFNSVPNETGNLGNVPGQQQSEQQSLAVTSVPTSYESSSVSLGVSSVSSFHALTSSMLTTPPLASSSTISVITSPNPSMPVSSSPSLPFSTALSIPNTVSVTVPSVAGFPSTSIPTAISHLPLTAPVVTPTVIPSVSIVGSVSFSPNICSGSSLLYQHHTTTSMMQSMTVSTFSPIASVTNLKPTSTETSLQTRLKAILISSDSEAEEPVVKENSESTSESDHRGYDFTQGSSPGVLKSTVTTTRKMEVHAHQLPQSVAKLYTDHHEIQEKTRVKDGIPKEQNEVEYAVSKSSVVTTSKVSPKVSRSRQTMSSEFAMKGHFVRTDFVSRIPRSQHTSLRDPVLKQKFQSLPGASPSPPMRSKVKQSLKQAINTKDKADIKVLSKRKQVVPTKDRDGHLESGSPFLKLESEATETHTDLDHAITVTKVGQLNSHSAFAMVCQLKTILPNRRIDNTESLFLTLSAKLSNWKMLGRYLLLSDEHIETISKIDSDQERQAYNMLRLWRSVNDKNATFLSLGEALCSCMQDQLVDELKQYSEGNTMLPVIEASKENKLVNDSDCDNTSEVSEASLVQPEETSASNVIKSEIASDFTVTGTIDTVLTILECTLKSQAKGSKVTVYVKYD